ncbi:MAG TPA: hybrid sensor histidine kinase/response regulator [Noviherbaspirillum sp.]|jgi:signal transduction histidine kinase|uniref:hybrid sensor histidine kinase/response regulator n=1 Tax=Noviherbaspirillum sp. TaxID=1926288 RepID=UPI002F92E8B8
MDRVQSSRTDAGRQVESERILATESRLGAASQDTDALHAGPGRRLLDAGMQLLLFRPGAQARLVPLAVQRVQLELLLEKTGPLRILSPLPFATPLALLFHMRWPSWMTIVWVLAFYAASIGCYLRRRKLERHRPVPDGEIAPVFRGRVVDILLLGTMWGLGPWMLDPHGDTAYLVLTSIFIIGAVSLGSAIVSTHRQIIAAFTIPAASGMITACAWFGGPIGWLLAFCLTLYLLMTLTWTYQQADLLEDSLVVRFEKEALAQQLENASREKTRFLASASHDLRQPLHAISLFTATLERASLVGPHAETVTQLARAVQVLNHSLETMLDVSRLDGGAVQPRISALHVHALFLSMHNTFAGRAQEKGLQLRLRAPGSLVVLSDALLLERLLGNLVDNAIKYTRTGGVLVAARTGAAAGRPGQVRFDVIDTGIGIPAEQHELVFEEFYQLGNPQRDRTVGLGIGLSIVRRLSDLLAHPIALKSRPRRGTCFHVWVPQGSAPGTPREDARTRPGQPPPAPATLPRHILVVDDEADSRRAMATLLAAYGCEVSTARDLEQAEALLRQASFEAVIADYRLPGERSGLDFLEAVRRAAPHLRTLLVTGETAPQRIASIKASGIRCLYKPVRAQHLLEALAS